MSIFKHLRHSFEWNKYYYYFSFGLTALSALIHYSGIEEFRFISGPLVIISLLCTFLSFQRDNFSIKYLQSLPLSKKELYHLKIGDSFLSLLPLMFWNLLFPDVIWELLTEKKDISFLDYLNLFGFYLVGAFLVSTWSFFKLYEASRSPYIKRSPYISMKLFIIYFSSFIYIIYGLTAVTLLLQSFAPTLLLEILEFLRIFKNPWTFLALGVIGAIYEYRRVFQRWLDEKRSYLKDDWKPLRDIPLMVVLVGLAFLPPYLTFRMEARYDYGPSGLIETVVSGKPHDVQKLLGEGADINKKTSLGYTALMTAAKLGDEKMYFYLLSRGASKKGSVVSTVKGFGDMNLQWLAVVGGNEAIVKDLIDSKFANTAHKKFYPLHVASVRCHEKVIDHLIELGADPNVKNEAGKTPLHKASESSCLNGTISLIEAGADLSHRDEVGKIALDYVKFNRDLKYYLERKSRSPAGK